MSRKHITTVTLNAAIDKTYFVPSLAAGQANRVRRMIAQPGGKGVNAARVAHLLGEPVVATGFVGGSAGQWIETALTEQGLRHQFVRAGGESRVCLNVVPDDGESVELLEPGLETRPEHYEELLHLLERLADTSSVIVLSGSVPSGGPPDIYRTIIERLKPYGMPVILDTSGAALLHGIAASPHMIKPNQEEMAHLTGSVRSALDEAALAEDVASLVRRGIPVAAVSLGSRGALAGLADAVYRIGAVPIEPVNVVGCGDAFIAGAAVGLHRGLPDEDLFKLAAACGASNALQLSAGVVDPAQVDAFSELVRVERIR
ncbi:1-phosphofructokinase family hexose kinase [Paenibacillus thermoaerophilus]|uniref:Tagatose-6-phosphate kinase n=1 Tax=Paenibacillus thermoaerophilus TaxID=1215385 RepID=A0ABW2V2I6_9BACL|nr:1-phosphofructokinase family hexose kinase [Paenibacillus thermoaerophilus]TMV10432.1 1-phosphofructokinase family hexose kinase [Paenibacillus thermoaerophilus]